MHSTLKSLVAVSPALKDGTVTGRYLTYPSAEGVGRQHGGLRLAGRFKRAAAGDGTPLVTVITVCRNAVATIEQCIGSVLRQTHPNVEYIVVDGASTDGTVECLRRHEHALDYWLSEPDTGLYQAMNKGLALAAGDYIMVLNADDWYADDCIESLVRAKRYSGASFVSALAQAVDGDGEPLQVMRSMPFDESVRLRMPLRHETMLLAASLYDAVGPYVEHYRVNSDFELAIRLFDAHCTAYEVPRPLLFFRNTGLSNSGSPALVEERMAIIAGQFPFIEASEARMLADRDLHAAQQLLDIARRYSEHEKLVNALRLYSEDNATRSAKPQWGYFRHRDIAWPVPSRVEDRPEISIILPVYNARETLPACLESVLKQSFRDFELICVDDLGPDDSMSLVESYRSRDSRTVVVRNERNIGHGASRNRGIRHARGRYIFHLDPDDSIPPDALKLLHARAVKHGSELVKGAYLREQFHHHTAMRRPEVRNVANNSRTYTHVAVADVPGIYTTLEGHWSYLYRADFARRVPYPEDLKMGQDGIFLVCALVQARTITVIKDVVYRYHWNPASAMNAFSFRKYLDVLEWRRRAWHMLDDAGLRGHGDELMEGYPKLLWHELFFRHHAANPDKAQLAVLADSVREAFRETGLSPAGAPDRVRRFFVCLLNGWIDEASELARTTPIGGAGAAGPSDAAKPLVSVILPVFNAQRTLAECIDSVLAQTLSDFELVCVNDCSTDDSQSIIDRYRARDPRIVSIVNEANLGHGGSRNCGIAAARGRYVFHVDPDDTLPPAALQALHSAAARHGSDLVKGAYLREQVLFGSGQPAAGAGTISRGSEPIANTTLARTPELLRNTEGHWSCLYEADLARRVPYPTDLKMGPDSLFMASVMPAARRVTVIDDVVYHYRANAASAMNTFNFRKYQDALEWRRRAWHVLKAGGFQSIGDRLLQSYWGAGFFSNLAAALTPSQLEEFLDAFRAVFAETGIGPVGPDSSPFLKSLFPLILAGRDAEARELMLAGSRAGAPALPSLAPGAGRRLKVATLSSWDHGGAGTGSRRRVAALRRHGIDARIYSLLVKNGNDHVSRLEPDPGARPAPQDEVWREVRKRAIDPARSVPGYRASEMFSLSDSVLDFRRLRGLFDEHDIVHLHWMVGMLDCEHVGEVLGRKPVVWTLADMNPFTGGCHYSEGCDGYKRECQRCPLLGGDTELAHRTWKIKKQAYEKLENLHIVCPSPWMAERARESSLLRGRPIHYIPNAMPVDALGLHAKTVARVRLGLPLDKKLLLFGADSLANVRKGSGVMRDALRSYCARRGAGGVELMVFGSGSLDAPLPVHRIGYVSNESRLALLYAAADAYLFPSREDNAPLTVGESMLCGTPVIAFPVGNVEALVEHRVTGYVAAHLDADDFAAGIEWALSAGPEAALERSARCRMAASRYHDPRLAAERHEALYRAAMDAGA